MYKKCIINGLEVIANSGRILRQLMMNRNGTERNRDYLLKQVGTAYSEGSLEIEDADGLRDCVLGATLIPRSDLDEWEWCFEMHKNRGEAQHAE
jgi:hypothetical protein